MSLLLGTRGVARYRMWYMWPKMGFEWRAWYFIEITSLTRCKFCTVTC
jgi:hypothetical protein